MSDWVPSYIETLEIECWISEPIQTTINFYSDVWLSPVILRDAQNWMLKLWANSKDNNFLLGCLIESRQILRRSKLKVEALSQFRRQYLFTRMSDWVLWYNETLEIECWSSELIQTTINFYSDVWLSPVIYRDVRNWMLKLWTNWNDNNFLLGCLIESGHISRRSKLNVEALNQFKRQ